MAIERNHRNDRWDDDKNEAANAAPGAEKFKALTREEAEILRAQDPPLSP